MAATNFPAGTPLYMKHIAAEERAKRRHMDAFKLNLEDYSKILACQRAKLSCTWTLDPDGVYTRSVYFPNGCAMKHIIRTKHNVGIYYAWYQPPRYVRDFNMYIERDTVGLKPRLLVLTARVPETRISFTDMINREY